MRFRQENLKTHTWLWLAKQAGQIGQKAEAKKIYLIHYSTGRFERGDLVAEAKSAFSGELELAKDFMVLEF